MKSLILGDSIYIFFLVFIHPKYEYEYKTMKIIQLKLKRLPNEIKIVIINRFTKNYLIRDLRA